MMAKGFAEWFSERTKGNNSQRAKKGATARHAKKVTDTSEKVLGAFEKTPKTNKQKTTPAKQEVVPAKQKKGQRKQTE
jgi:hypothetical protein